MLLAVVAAWWLMRSRDLNSRLLPFQSRLLPFQKLGIGIGGIAGATIAAKFPFVLLAMLGSDDSPARWLSAWFEDGKTILWGLAGGYAGVELAKWSLLVKQRTGDFFVVPVATAIAIGRLGCLCYGCCHGVPTDLPWGVQFAVASDGGTLFRHPTQLYEFLFHGTFAFAAAFAINRKILAGCWMLVYLISYCGYRFASEWIRPEEPFALGMTFYQLSAIMFGVLFALLLAHRFGRP